MAWKSSSSSGGYIFLHSSGFYHFYVLSCNEENHRTFQAAEKNESARRKLTDKDEKLGELEKVLKSLEEKIRPIDRLSRSTAGTSPRKSVSFECENEACKKAKEDLLKAPLVFESANQVSSNYGSWGKKRKNVDWTDKETLKFYKGLSVFGTDFSMMESVFKRR